MIKHIAEYIHKPVTWSFIIMTKHDALCTLERAVLYTTAVRWVSLHRITTNSLVL